MMHGFTDVPVSTFFQTIADSCTRGHSMNLVKSHCYTDLRSQGRVANPRAVATTKTGRVLQPITDAF